MSEERKVNEVAVDLTLNAERRQSREAEMRTAPALGKSRRGQNGQLLLLTGAFIFLAGFGAYVFVSSGSPEKTKAAAAKKTAIAVPPAKNAELKALSELVNAPKVEAKKPEKELTVDAPKVGQKSLETAVMTSSTEAKKDPALELLTQGLQTGREKVETPAAPPVRETQPPANVVSVPTSTVNTPAKIEQVEERVSKALIEIDRKVQAAQQLAKDAEETLAKVQKSSDRIENVETKIDRVQTQLTTVTREVTKPRPDYRLPASPRVAPSALESPAPAAETSASGSVRILSPEVVSIRGIAYHIGDVLSINSKRYVIIEIRADIIRLQDGNKQNFELKVRAH